MTPLQVTVFTDFACPYSYLSEAVLWDLREADITLRFRAFELYPDAAESPTSPWTPAERVAIERLSYEAGVVVEEPPFTVRGRKAHEASVFARERGVEIDLRKAMYAAYWRDGSDIGRIDVLCELASNLGLDADDLKIALDIDRYRDEVVADRDVAERLRIPGTPTIFLGTGRSAGVLVGARPADELREAVRAALSRPDDT